MKNVVNRNRELLCKRLSNLAEVFNDMNIIYRNMIKKGMSKEDVHEIAQGRVWTGEDAMKIGLVDVFGGLEDAVRLAAEKAGLENYRIAELPAQKNPFELILNNLSASVKENVLRTELGGWYEWYQNHKALLTTQGVMARIPYDIVFN